MMWSRIVTEIGWVGTVAGTALTCWQWKRAIFHKRRADRAEMLLDFHQSCRQSCSRPAIAANKRENAS